MSKNKKSPVFRRVSRNVKLRTGLIFLVILGLMCFLIGGIILINRNSGNDYSKTVLRQMTYESQTIPAKRGMIYDRNGILLAYNENEYNVIIEPKNILLNDGENLDATVKALVECFDVEEDEVRKKIEDNKNSYYQVLTKEVSEEQKQGFDAYVEKYQAEVSEYIKKQREEARNSSEPDTSQEDMTIIQKIKDFFSHGESEKIEIDDPGDVVGVYFEVNQKRIYPYNSLASTTIGYCNNSGGVFGLERYYNDDLEGTPGRKYGYLGENSSVDVQTVEAVDGYSLESTLDVNIQKICENVINNYDKKVGSNVTALMAMDPNTGEILAMAHSGLFDLNDAPNIKTYLPAEEYKEIERLKESKNEEDKKEAERRTVEARVNKWRNFCISSSYEPGSTAKVFTIAAALEENAITEDSTWYCDGVGTYGGSHIHCWERRGHHTQTLTETLMNSCNDALMQIGSKTGIESFTEYQSRFNIGRYTGIDLPDELDCSRQIYRSDNMTSVDLATNSFGQNFYVTMVQMCSAYCSLVNGGYYYKPHVVSRIADAQGNTIRKIDPVVVRQTVSAATSEFMKEALYQVVANGTGARVQIKGYEIGGKTGTAEKNSPNDEEETYTVSLMAVVPAYDPQLVLYAVVDEPHCSKAENTFQAKDVCRAALEKILPYMNIYPSGDDDDVVADSEIDEMYMGSLWGDDSETDEDGNPVVDGDQEVNGQEDGQAQDDDQAAQDNGRNQDDDQQARDDGGNADQDDGGGQNDGQDAGQENGDAGQDTGD